MSDIRRWQFYNIQVLTQTNKYSFLADWINKRILYFVRKISSFYNNKKTTKRRRNLTIKKSNLLKNNYKEKKFKKIWELTKRKTRKLTYIDAKWPRKRDRPSKNARSPARSDRDTSNRVFYWPSSLRYLWRSLLYWNSRSNWYRRSFLFVW